MARIISYEELLTAEESTGWLENLYIDESGTKRENELEAIAYNRKGYACLGGSGTFDFENYNKEIQRTHEEYIKYCNDGDTTLYSGFRVWDNKPTQEEMNNAAWEVKT